MGKASSIQIHTSTVVIVMIACSPLQMNKLVGFFVGEGRVEKGSNPMQTIDCNNAKVDILWKLPKKLNTSDIVCASQICLLEILLRRGLLQNKIYRFMFREGEGDIKSASFSSLLQFFHTSHSQDFLSLQHKNNRCLQGHCCGQHVVIISSVGT